MVEDREIVIKLSGDRGEYGTVTVQASQLDSPGVEEEIRRVYEAGGLPTFMAKDLARRVVEDVKAGEEKRLSTEGTETGVGKKGFAGETYTDLSADEIGFLVSSSMWNDRKFQSLQAFFYYCCCYFHKYEGITVGGHVIGDEEELSELVVNYGGRYNTLLVFVHGYTLGGHYHAEGGLPLSRVAETCDAIMPVGPGRKAIILSSCTAERIPGYYPGVEVLGAKVYALTGDFFTDFSYGKGVYKGEELEYFELVQVKYSGKTVWRYLKGIYGVEDEPGLLDYVLFYPTGKIKGYRFEGGDDEEEDKR